LTAALCNAAPAPTTLAPAAIVGAFAHNPHKAHSHPHPAIEKNNNPTITFFTIVSFFGLHFADRIHDEFDADFIP
jgi:hypothetical protein